MMEKNSSITSAGELLALFIDGYRRLPKLVPIDSDTQGGIESSVAGLKAGQNLDWIQQRPDFEFQSRAGNVTCCEHFLGFLDQLHRHMHASQVFSVSHERALALLYAYDQYKEFTQPFLQWFRTKEGQLYLKSTALFDVQFGRNGRVRITVQADADDPTVFDEGWADPRGSYLEAE